MDLYPLHRQQSINTSNSSQAKKGDDDIKSRAARALQNSTKESKAWKDRHDQLSITHDKLRQDHAKTVEVAYALQERLDTKEDHIQSLSDSLKSSKNKSELSSSAEEHVRVLQAKLKSKTEELRDLQGRYDKVRDIKESFKAMRSDFDATKVSLASKKSQILQLQEDIKSVQKLKTQLAESNTARLKLLQENENLSKKLDDALVQLKSASKDTSRIKDMNKVLQDSKESLKTVTSRTHEELQDAKRCIEKFTDKAERFDSMKQELEDERQRSALLKKRAESVDTELKALRKSTEAQQAGIRNEAKKFQACQEMLRKSDAALQACSDIHSDKDSRLASALQDIHASVAQFLGGLVEVKK